jgi:hypothetical protein
MSAILANLICDRRHAGLTRLLGMKVEIYQLPTLPTSSLRTSSLTSGGPLAPSGSLRLMALSMGGLVFGVVVGGFLFFFCGGG